MFEADAHLSSDKFVNELNDKLMHTVGVQASPMGLHGIRCEMTALMRGKEYGEDPTGKVIILGAVDCFLRSLILGTLFGIPKGEEDQYKLIPRGEESEEALNFFTIGGLSPNRTLLPEDSSRIRDILDSVIEHFGKVTAIECGLYRPNSVFIKNGRIFEDESGLLPEIVKALLDSPGGVNIESIIAENIKKTGSTRLIANLVKNAPELWRKVKPFLGHGGNQMEELADLGF